MKRRVKLTIVITLLFVLGLYTLRFSPVSYTILRHSSQEGYYWIVATQLALGVKPDGPDRTALIESIYNNHPAIAELLVRHGADLERQWMSGEPNGPPLAWALMYGQRDTAKMLLHHGARADYKPRYGMNTALHMAVELNDADLVDLLLQKAADPNACDRSGETALMLAVAYKRHNIETILRRAGAKDSHKTLSWPPQHYCVYVRNTIPLSKTY